MKPRASKAQSDIFVWSAKYQVGISTIDRQHKKLVALINTLAKKLADQADSAALMRVFDDLAGYANYHFKTEENLMQEWEIDADFEAAHRQSHAAFVEEVAKARASARKNPLQMSTKTLTFLSRWLMFHILGTDMRMANEIIALEKGLTPAEARNRAIEKMADAHEVLLHAMSELYESLATRTQDFLQANHQLKEEIAFHQRAEAELRKLSLAVEHSPVSIFITNADGIFEYVNPKFVEVTGYTMEELAGRTPRILKAGDMPDEAYAEFWRAIAGKNEWFGEFHNCRKNGQLYWGKTSVTPIVDADGSVTHFLTIQEDITERKATEAKLSQSHDKLLASLSELKGHSDDLALLNQTSELLLTCVSAEETYGAIAQMAERLSLGIGGSLAVVDDGAEPIFRTVAAWGRGATLLDSFGGDACWAIRRGQLHEVATPTKGLVCSHFQRAPDAPYLCLPLVIQGKTMGILHVETVAGLDEAQRTRLAQVSTALGNAFKLALTNIRLLGAARQGGTRKKG